MRRAWPSAASASRLEDLNEALAAGKVDTLNLILKGDVSGSVEALEDALLKIDVGEEVDLRIIHRGVGAITQNDVNLATVDEAIIIGFNVRPAERVAELADREGVDMRFYSVIHQAIDDVESPSRACSSRSTKRCSSARRRSARSSSRASSATWRARSSGPARSDAHPGAHRARWHVIGEADIAGLRRFKDDVTEVRDGFECGINLGGFNNIEIDDVIETFEMREKPRS